MFPWLLYIMKRWLLFSAGMWDSVAVMKLSGARNSSREHVCTAAFRSAQPSPITSPWGRLEDFLIKQITSGCPAGLTRLWWEMIVWKAHRGATIPGIRYSWIMETSTPNNAVKNQRILSNCTTRYLKVVQRLLVLTCSGRVRVGGDAGRR